MRRGRARTVWQTAARLARATSEPGACQLASMALVCVALFCRRCRLSWTSFVNTCCLLPYPYLGHLFPHAQRSLRPDNGGMVPQRHTPSLWRPATQQPSASRHTPCMTRLPAMPRRSARCRPTRNGTLPRLYVRTAAFRLALRTHCTRTYCTRTAISPTYRGPYSGSTHHLLAGGCVLPGDQPHLR